MSKALYTKYRPQTFDEVIGQEVAVQILQKSIETERINHAYLFYGIRGTGKTTLARLFAKTINCISPKTGNPCNQCDSCKSVNNSSQIDVIEMDAASNNGVDEIRDLTEKANYATTSSKYKVYIIDEVHMLTKSSFNALLKTLEEPPKNTIFLLATTEINRIPDTILSRTVVLNMQLVNRKEIIKQLIKILDKEEKSYEKSALEYIATLSEGSVRDAISYLQTTLLYDDLVSKKNVIKVLGVADIEKIEQELLSNGDVNLLIDESMNGRRLMIILIDLLIKLISSGRHEFKQLLSKLTDGFIAIKDPMLLNKFIISVLMEVEIKTTPITELESKKFEQNLNAKIEQTIEFKVDEIIKQKISMQDVLRAQQEMGTKEARILLGEEPTIETPVIEETVEQQELTIETPVIEETVEQQEPTIETPVIEETVEQQEPTIETPVIEETVEQQEPTTEKSHEPVNFNSKDYVWTMINSDDASLSTVKNKWILLRTIKVDAKQQAIVNLLLESKPLIATKESAILGLEDDFMINELKKEINSSSMKNLLIQVFGKPIILMPTNSNNWSKLIGVATKVKKNNVEIEFSLNSESFFKKEKNEEDELARDLFGDKLVSE